MNPSLSTTRVVATNEPDAQATLEAASLTTVVRLAFEFTVTTTRTSSETKGETKATRLDRTAEQGSFSYVRNTAVPCAWSSTAVPCGAKSEALARWARRSQGRTQRCLDGSIACKGPISGVYLAPCRLEQTSGDRSGKKNVTTRLTKTYFIGFSFRTHGPCPTVRLTPNTPDRETKLPWLLAASWSSA